MNSDRKELLWKHAPLFDPALGQEAPSVTPYLLPGKQNSCVIVCPGGAYGMRADHEGEPIAKMLNDAGLSAFVLNYRVAPYHHPVEMMDVKRSVRFVRFHSKRFGIDPGKIWILGFSAGGHLAVTALEHFDYGVDSGDEIDRVSSRPDAGVLCYAVVSLLNHTHIGSRVNLLDEEECVPLCAQLSGEYHVREDMPPVFLWHTAADSCVPVQNSLNMAIALKQKNIPFELHIFPDGEHGLGLAQNTPGADQWPSLLVNWLHRIGF